MVKLWLCILFVFVFFNEFSQTNAVNHWIVTQTGKIQAYLETPFDLRRPYDLLALLDQETRRNEINELYDDLMNRKNTIEDKWVNIEKNSNIGSRISSQDPDCLAAGKSFSDIDLYGNIATNGTDRKGIVINISKKVDSDTLIMPVCINFSKINGENEDVPSVNRTNITLLPDETLKKYFLPVSPLEYFGHFISTALDKNSTSWVHYNLASIFWRIKGNGERAIDCIKLAVQYVTPDYRDIPLHNLAGILHQARYSKEAAQILHSAIDMAPTQAIHYLAIGNVYAALGDYGKSVKYYNKYLELKPGHKDTVSNRHAILCYWKLESGLTNFQSDLQNILTDLHDYHSLQQQWLRLQERLMWEHASFEYHYDGIYPEVMKGDSAKKVQRCVQKTSENTKKPVISCDFYDKGPDLDNLNLQNLFQFVENEKQKLTEHIGKSNFEGNTEEKFGDTPPVLYPKFPTSMSTKGNEYFDITGWPTKEDCVSWDLEINEEDDLNLPLFLPPENKGYQLQKILSEYIDLSDGSQHELPWYPPVCKSVTVNGEKYLPPNERHILDNEIKSNTYLRNHLLKYVNDGKADEAEIGQRIISAMEKKAAPKWVLATLASLYWRVRGNARNAMDCLDMAFQIVPKDTTDIVLVSLGSMMYQMGFVEQAIKFATLAFKINYIEPSTNFLLAILHYTHKNPLLAMYYMKNVLRVDPEFYDGVADTLLKTWGCRIKLGGYKFVKPETDTEPQDICIKRESFKGEGVLCSKNGELCKSATIHCYKRSDIESDKETGGNKPSDMCANSPQRVNLGQSIISSLLAAEGSGDIEPDQSRLEILNDDPKNAFTQHIHHHLHMRLSLGEEHPLKEHEGLGDFFVSATLTDDPESENHLLVYDKYATYTLSVAVCKNAKMLQKFKYSSVWPSIVARSLDLTSYLMPLQDGIKMVELRPYCIKDFNKQMPYDLDELTKKILNYKLPSSPEKDLVELLGLMASNQKIPVKELGARLSVALKKHEDSWVLLTASSIYWRIIGDSEEAVICLRAALTQAPQDMLDIPLTHLASFLNRVGYHSDALHVGNLALRTSPNFVLNHFTLANIHISMGEYEKAVTFFRACLSLDSHFEPARSRLKAALCTLLFDDTSNAAASAARKIMQVLD